MPTKRVRRSRDRMPTLSEGARWWIEHGRPLGIPQAKAMGCFEDPVAAAWEASNLHFCRSVKLTRERLRELGFAEQIEAHVRAGRCPPAGWRG